MLLEALKWNRMPLGSESWIPKVVGFLQGRGPQGVGPRVLKNCSSQGLEAFSSHGMQGSMQAAERAGDWRRALGLLGDDVDQLSFHRASECGDSFFKGAVSCCFRYISLPFGPFWGVKRASKGLEVLSAHVVEPRSGLSRCIFYSPCDLPKLHERHQTQRFRG